MPKPKTPKRKLQSSARPDPVNSGESLEVIVKVTETDYVPKGVSVRAQISPVLFTCNIPALSLEALEQDPKVHTVSVSQTLRTVNE